MELKNKFSIGDEVYFYEGGLQNISSGTIKEISATIRINEETNEEEQSFLYVIGTEKRELSIQEDWLFDDLDECKIKIISKLKADINRIIGGIKNYGTEEGDEE